jgi:hypothetical protein|tara:strand:+ start:3601 stop:3858 length:258 start_codon:yes stop_codon:yes gene_type:complete
MKSNKEKRELLDERKRFKAQAKGLDLKQLHWVYADSVRQAGIYEYTHAKTSEAHKRRAAFFLERFQTLRAKEQEKVRQRIAAEVK